MGKKPRPKPQHLAAKLLAIRLHFELSQSQLMRALVRASGCNLSNARISEYETGTREPSLLVLLGYSKLSRVSINVLVDDDVKLKLS